MSEDASFLFVTNHFTRPVMSHHDIEFSCFISFANRDIIGLPIATKSKGIGSISIFLGIRLARYIGKIIK